jgi:hypothetical protein
MVGTKSSLPRGKRVKYTQQGFVHRSIALEHDSTHTEVPEVGNEVRKRKGRGLGKVVQSRPPNQQPEVWPVVLEEFTTEKTDKTNPKTI